MKSLVGLLGLVLTLAAPEPAPFKTDIHGLFVRADGSFVTTGKRGTICSLPAKQPNVPTGTCSLLGDGLLTAVDFKGDLGITVGEGGTIFVTTDGGQTWAQKPSPATYHLLDVAVLSGTSAVAVGDWGTVVRTKDQGKTWLDVSLEVPYTPEAVAVPVLSRDVRDPSTGETQARGTELGPAEVEALTTAGTALWVRDDTILNDLLPLAADRLYAVGERGRIYLSTDQGRSFRLLARTRPASPDPFAEGDAEETLFFATGEGRTLWVGGSLGYLEKVELKADGSIASSARIDLPEARERAIFTGATRGATLCLGGAEGLMIASFDGGKTFRSADHPDYAARWVRRAAASDGECLFAGEKGLILAVKP
ncbi:MAG: hypothetical protein HYY13_13390 [Nitrospirae bacterium]|nr:hypothetical protein [Nitrospirota bacterium]